MTTSLSYKETGFQKIKSHIVKNKLIYIGISLVLIAGIGIFYLLITVAKRQFLNYFNHLLTF